MSDAQAQPGVSPVAAGIQPPYGAISDGLRNGVVVPFLGAGVNFGHRPPNSKYAPGCAFLPSGAELAAELAARCSFPSTKDHERADLARVASYFAEADDRDSLRQELRKIFSRQYPTCAIHTYLAELAAKKPLLVVTTNYDDLLEQAFAAAFAAAKAPFDLVTHPTDRDDWANSVLLSRRDPGDLSPRDPRPVAIADLDVDPEKTSVIYKMHGTVYRTTAAAASEWDGYVITEDDYVDFLSRMTHQSAIPPAIITHLSTRKLLFLGYGLKDWNLRVVLRDLFNGRRRRAMWAIQFRPDPLECKLWDQRGVNIYDQDINELVAGLRRWETANPTGN